MQPGDKIGRYLLEKPLGEGAMSVVFVAKHPQLEPRVALKILRREVISDRQYADRFLEDARAAASLNHPNIVGVKDFDTADGVPFIVMELVDGWSLEHWLKEKGKLEIRDAARVARDVALGLGAAHASKIVHRDVKPSNVLIDSRTGTAKLTDFGAAKRDRPEDQQLTAHGQTIGTPRYMAPEQVHGEPVDPRTDLWALGATLFEMLAGQPAFSATSLPRLYQAIIADDPPRLAGLRPDVPPELAALVARLLSKSRVARPDTADEVAEALLPFARPGGASTTATTTVQQPATATRTTPIETAVARKKGGGLSRPALIGGGIAAAAVVAGLVYALLPGEEPVLEPGGTDVAAVPAPPRAPEPTPGPLPVVVAEPPPAPAPAPEAAPSPPEPVEPPVQQAAPPAPPELAPQEQAALPPEPELPPIDEAELGAALEGLPCIDVMSTVAEGGEVRLAGTVADAELAATAKRAISSVTGVQSVTDALRVLPAPGCLAAAKVERAVADSSGPAPSATLNRPDGVYREGDFVVLNVTMSPSGAEYLYVDLLTDAGAAIHLIPEPLTPDNRLAAGQTVRLGVEESEQAEGVRHWQVVPPLGTGYLVLTASEKPLYAGMREIEEPLQGYLDVLLPALDDPATGTKAVNVERIEFVGRVP
jgi:serine/threonine-protein kinase